MHVKENLRKQLLAELSRRNTDLIVQWIIDNPDALKPLIELIISHEKKVAPRASWVLEKLSEKSSEPAAEYLNVLIAELNNVPESGTRRTLAKVLMLHTIPEEQEGLLLDFCFRMLESAKEPVAVKSNCMTILFNLLPKYPELKHELFSVIEDQIPDQSVGFKSRFNVLKRKFQKLL